MSHRERVESEFTRQAETFRTSKVLAAATLTARVGEALGDGLDRILDVACGPGMLLPTLAERAGSVFGVDLTAENLRLAREAGWTQLARAFAEQLPFAPGAFDAATLRLAVHHFERPVEALASLHGVLRPGGRLVVLDLLAPGDPGEAALRDALERMRDTSHTQLLSRDAMRAALEEAGFALREERCWSEPRTFAEWARIIHEPRRMADLELVLRAFARADRSAGGLDLREEEDGLAFTYEFGLFVAEAKPGA